MDTMTRRNQLTRSLSGLPDDHPLDAILVRDLRNRLHSLEGHVRGIERMVDQQAGCVELLIQTSAVRAALNQINIRILEGYVEPYLRQCAKEGDWPGAVYGLRGALTQILRNG